MVLLAAGLLLILLPISLALLALILLAGLLSALLLALACALAALALLTLLLSLLTLIHVITHWRFLFDWIFAPVDKELRSARFVQKLWMIFDQKGPGVNLRAHAGTDTENSNGCLDNRPA